MRIFCPFRIPLCPIYFCVSFLPLVSPPLIWKARDIVTVSLLLKKTGQIAENPIHQKCWLLVHQINIQGNRVLILIYFLRMLLASSLCLSNAEHMICTQ